MQKPIHREKGFLLILRPLPMLPNLSYKFWNFPKKLFTTLTSIPKIPAWVIVHESLVFYVILQRTVIYKLSRCTLHAATCTSIYKMFWGNPCIVVRDLLSDIHSLCNVPWRLRCLQSPASGNFKSELPLVILARLRPWGAFFVIIILLI